jgi:hypothetical protein
MYAYFNTIIFGDIEIRGIEIFKNLKVKGELVPCVKDTLDNRPASVFILIDS